MESTASNLVQRFSIRRIHDVESERVMDTVATEEPLGIRIIYSFKGARFSDSLALTMRTPGNDRELAAGFLLSEGVIRQRRDLLDVRPLGAEPSNEIVAELADDVDVENWRVSRASFINSSCGICGKRTREAAFQEIARPSGGEEARIDQRLVERLPALLLENQRGFEQTGGLHAAACVTREGLMEAAFEDIGRHNALDKLIGWSLLQDKIPLENRILFLSSRSSFELIQKAAMAGASILATVGGPSSLAIETARQWGMTLIGFVRDGRFNIYSGEWRIH
ncbi:MAG TPA: formate dehydrogenase accessory sulfurtransferase FdhD [Bryobacteraceae bacterium]|jgi:FdhD protein|nr:formate dehydrogenase accessory sulfurtransferase FdhD [Bryobacteraceae bacterium]